MYLLPCAILNEAGGYIGGITALDAEHGLIVLFLIHCKSETQKIKSNYSIWSSQSFPFGEIGRFWPNHMMLTKAWDQQ